MNKLKIERPEKGVIVREPHLVYDQIFVDEAYLGMQIREHHTQVNVAVIHNPVCDAIQTWNNDITVHELFVYDDDPYTYSKSCHKDVIQLFRKNPNKPFNLQIGKPVSRVIVEELDAVIRGNGKSGVMVSEIGGIEDSSFFTKGITFDSDSDVDYLFSADRISNVTFGSNENPIDVDSISGKRFRVGNIKSNEANCAKWTVHIVGDVQFELSDAARRSLNIVRHLKEL